MIKNNGFILFISLLFFSPVRVIAQTSDELYQKVFGKNQEVKKVVLDATLEEFYLGGILAVVVNEKIISLSAENLESALIDKIRENKRFKYKMGKGDIEPSKLPFKIVYSPSELRLSIEIPAADLEPHSANAFDDVMPYYSRKAVNPATFSFGTNYKLEEILTKKIDQKDSFGVQTDSFMSFKDVTFENQMNYLSTRVDNEWYRQNSKMTYDRPGKMQRLEMGDVNYPIVGYQQSHTLGGVSLYRDFSLNPYRVSGPTSSFEYEIDTRSLVRTYINNTVIKTEYMNPGRYSVKDIPLNNGVNKILVEITDEFGKKKVLIFNEAGSAELLAPGLSRYSLAAGYPSYDTDTIKKYDDKHGAFYSAFYQYGVNRFYSASAYLQGNKQFTLLGSNNILATSYGNWIFDGVGSKTIGQSGTAIAATYLLNLFGAYWYDSHTLSTKIEYRSPWFNEAGSLINNRFDIITNASYSVPLFEKFSLSIGGNYQHPRIGDTGKFGYDTSLTSRLFTSSSLTFYLARSRNENKTWETQLYCFLNIAFGESSTYVSAFYEKGSQTKRLTLINDNGKKLNSLKTSANFDDNTNSRNGALDLQYNTVLADLGMREEILNTKGLKTGSRTSLRFLSAFAFVYNDHESGFSISRPIANSFVLFKPNEGWKGQKFGAQTSGGDNETETGFFHESLISGLSPYQYRRLQLDPSHLDPGYILGQESFVVYPHYRSGHLFVVGKSGLIVVKGTLLDRNNKPQVLKVGYWVAETGKTTPFFTGREGEFFIEGVEPTLGKIQLEGEDFEAKSLDLKNQKSGLIDIGSIVLPNKESRL